MSIPNKLAYLKRKTGLTSEEISHFSGVPLGTFNKIASGKTRSPSPFSLDHICRVLRVPMRYLLDDSIPEECNIGSYSEALGVTLVSEREQALMWKYNRLSEHGRDAVDTLIDMLADQVDGGTPQGGLICYVPIAAGPQGCYADGFWLKPIRASLDSVTAGADFAIQVVGDSVMPVHASGTVLAVRMGKPTNHQLALFLVNHKGYVRKHCKKRGNRVLESINPDQEDILLTDLDEIHCLGVILGPIRNYTWL